MWQKHKGEKIDPNNWIRLDWGLDFNNINKKKAQEKDQRKEIKILVT